MWLKVEGIIILNATTIFARDTTTDIKVKVQEIRIFIFRKNAKFAYVNVRTEILQSP